MRRHQDEDLRLFLRQRIYDDQQTKRFGVVEKTYLDGSVYLGGIEGDTRKGYGVYYYKNDDVFAGEWRDDRFDGYGIYLFRNGEKFVGTLRGGAKEG